MTIQKRIITDREHQVYQNRYATVFDNEVTFPDGERGRYLKFQWSAPYGVAILPILEDGRLHLINNFRYASNRMCIEIPKGFGSEGIPPVEAAARELLEETGLRATHFRLVASLSTEAGLMDHLIHLFEARGARPASQPSPEPTEVFGEPLIVGVAEAIDMVLENKIFDSLSVNALLLHGCGQSSKTAV
jgi:ADP-ribose pyrophosphatase